MKASPRERTGQLLRWYRANRRELPWRRTADPYRVWVSEVMLQQTRVEAALPYYERFVRQYPNVRALARASIEEVLANWAGLGYYRRARMLHATAGRVVSDHGGEMPSTYEALARLPGIGEYTAAAIASIAFDEPRAALDGNAFRVLARLLDERRDMRAAASKRSLKALAESLANAAPKGRRGDFTQALMELGATVCIPQRPRCDKCPLALSCAGFAAGTAPELPYRPPRQSPRKVSIAVAIARRDGCVLVRQRPADATVMPGFWELPTVEGSIEALQGLALHAAAPPRFAGEFVHSITTTQYACRVYLVFEPEGDGAGCSWVGPEQLRALPLTTISRKALRIASGLAEP